MNITPLEENMRTKRIEQLKQSLIITLLLFAVTMAGSGIVGLIPKTDETEAPTVITEEPAFAEEVFAILPQQETVTVFSGFQAPLTGTVSSAYGYRSDPFSGEIRYHKGVDVAVSEGTEVCAASGGRVKESSYNSIGGHYVVLDHGNGIESYYGHLQIRTVSRGDTVEQGEIIGLSGKTGKVTGAHLHFQLTYNERTVDPEKYLDLTP